MLLENWASGSERNSYIRNKLAIAHKVLTRSGGTHDFVSADLIGLAPGAHDEGVVESHNGHNVHTLSTELRQILDISGHVVHRASRGEST
jgi:hypothetical protein